MLPTPPAQPPFLLRLNLQWIKLGMLNPNVQHNSTQAAGVFSNACITTPLAPEALKALVKIQSNLGDIKVCALLPPKGLLLTAGRAAMRGCVLTRSWLPPKPPPHLPHAEQV